MENKKKIQNLIKKNTEYLRGKNKTSQIKKWMLKSKFK